MKLALNRSRSLRAFGRGAARTSLCASPLLLLALAACGSPAEPANGSGAPAVSRQPVAASSSTRIAHALPRGGSSTVSVHTLPDATCTLRGEGQSPDVSGNLTIFADDEGVARLYLHHADPAIERTSLALDCKDDAGRTVTHPIDITVDDAAVAQAPEPFVKVGKPTLPLLDVDPLTLSHDEIVRRGYPPRPDANRAPERYAQWADMIARAPTVIQPHLVADPVGRHGPTSASGTTNGTGSSQIWSGYVIQTPSTEAQLGEVFGELSIPTVSSQAGADYFNYTSFWVGLDGYGTAGVVQDGTQQNTQTLFGFQASSYFAWTEWYPIDSQSVSNFPVQPGDTVWAWTWVGSANEGFVFPYTGQPIAANQFGAPAKWSGVPFYGSLGGPKTPGEPALASYGTLTADVNGDGKADAVGFNATNQYVMLSNGSGFGPPTLWSGNAFYGTEGTVMGDVNGDHKADAIGFNTNNTYVMLSSGSGFGPPLEWSTAGLHGAFGTVSGDVNGDGKADVVAFNATNQYVMLSNGSGFGPPTLWSGNAFYGTQGTVLGDVNGDGKADAIGFNTNNTYVMISTGSGFGPPLEWSSTGFDGTYGTYAGDVNGDGKADVVAFNAENQYVMLSNGTAFGQSILWSGNAFYGTFGTMMADVNGDGKSDCVGYNATNAYVELSEVPGGDVFAPGNVGWFYLYNATQNVATANMSTTQPSGAPFIGHEAEWIMERPTVNGSITTLANYSTATLSGAWASDYQGVTHYYSSDTSTQLQMTENANGTGDVLSTVVPVNQGAMRFTWHNYN
jgi:hypothetical protein